MDEETEQGGVIMGWMKGQVVGLRLLTSTTHNENTHQRHTAERKGEVTRCYGRREEVCVERREEVCAEKGGERRCVWKEERRGVWRE